MSARDVAVILMMWCAVASAETPPPTLTVTGHGVAQATPDQAIVVVAALAQDKQASEAQAAVNRAMTRATAAVTALGLPAEGLTTTGITLLPLYQDTEPRAPGDVPEPRIVGYQASNRLQVRVDDVTQVGAVIDSAVNAGVNEIESVTLGLKDDRALRRAALVDAAKDARLHADTIASTMGVRLLSVEEVTEQGAGIAAPLMRSAASTLGGAATPVQRGQVRIEATVVARYRIGPERGAQAPK